MAFTLLTLGLGVWLSGGWQQTDWLHLLPLVLLVRGLGLDMTGAVRLADALRELHLARGELARRAVTEERLRMARDLHDLLGHSLSLITLKAELAGRLMEKQPGRAAQEIRDLEQVARQALRDVREAVTGYRQPTLNSELEGARQMLEAAGIQSTFESLNEPLPADTDAVLAWTVREGVTNVIRHSRARHCTIRVSASEGLVRVEVSNDGEPPSTAVIPNSNKPSSGLAGLRERVSAHGGRMEAAPLHLDTQTCFRLCVELPLRSPAQEPQR
jgi:two-component system sensor histidine kinase DesK